jgi:hypothetical protein
MRPNRLALALLASAASWAGYAGAVGTRTFELDSIERLSGGDLKGTSVSSDGVVRAGFTLGNVSLPDTSAVWSIVPFADGVLAGVTDGKVMRVAADHATVFADTGAAAVTSLAVGAGTTVYAGTIPDGKIFRVSQGKAELFATLPDVHNIWALAYDKTRGDLFAAVGPEGRVFRIAANGSAAVYLSTDEPNLVSLAIGSGGEVYAGSSGRGLLYRINGPGRASVVFDFPGDTATEVRAIALTKSGGLYVLDNEYSEPPDPAKRSLTSGRTAAALSSAARPKPGKGALYRFDAKDRPEKMMHHDEFHYMSLALDDTGRPYVGTGLEGRVYSVDDAHVVTLVADTDERQVGALLVTGGGKTPVSGFVASSDPAALHRILGRGGVDSVWTSKPLDAGLRARFGHLTWHATGAIELSTRTGNTAVPEATWSEWSVPLPNAAAISSPPGRYVQVRARWASDPAAELSDVIVPFVTENVRPVVLEVGAQQKGTTRETKEGLPASGGEPPKHDSVVKVSWKVENPDNDQLRYRVAFRREGQSQWRDVVRPEEVFTKSEVDWDTLALPEGKYRVRVEASDEIANPPETVQKHALESAPVVVDNTPPVFRALTLTGRRLRARVTDGVSPIVRVELTIDGKLEWRPLAAADGVFDSPDEEVDTDVASLVPPGSHIVAVRAFDEAGNAVTQELESTP